MNFIFEIFYATFSVFQSGAIKKLIPLFDRVLVQRAAAETKTKGGVLIPEKAQGKVLEATVIAVGPGSRTEVRFCARLLVAIMTLYVYCLQIEISSLKISTFN